MKNKKKEHIPLSASRIKTLQGCSWRYFCSYQLKLPDGGNLGSNMGSIVHLIMELLANPRHAKLYKKALRTKNIYKVEPLRRLVKKHFAAYGIKDRDAAILLNEMTMQGLTYDFFGKKLGTPTKSYSELPFDMIVKGRHKNYRIKGFIDKLFLYSRTKTALIRDFKTSKKMFEGKEIDDNLQDQMYALAVKKLFPEYKKIIVEFPFLQLMPSLGQKAVLRMEKLDEDDLEGFEYVLTEVQKEIDQFSPKTSQRNLAANKPFPEDKSFSGKLLCGFDAFKGHLKKDGTPRWGCPAKWGRDYYAIKNKNGETIALYEMDDYDKIEYDESAGQYISIFKYKGCPAWNRQQYRCE